MPLFEFECGSCQHRFEELLTMSDTTLPECPECHEDQVKKLVSAGAFRANGASASSGGYSAPSCSPGGG
ncbi:MAG: zinc ribbon domain-containing protein [Deltaproteobacteria bacterium]|jgi:putative FmdB family regulatory protein|nr:zinc ribbon domain-containing protein [Deltaproteobacteria bacterium]MBT4644591.1 zinc ribbon domain-containing protein [Deltaproteobacteria bacterium]MBT6501577.1 zinc ribbon domain-containing protein [Deltaproteobacteria bacterium]MBT6614024.1 zinc ribbon domain-containing protein [Deltaproteobacteria bacterium]MBT7151150.1 zinc ribbon domain-containing protein [Deltaproteobacteria bacterium]